MRLDPEVLAKIGPLELRARLIVEGFLAGMHKSPQRGISIEFADHRVYAQGDDLRHIDWKLFGRTDKYYIKEYEQETNLHLILALDRSESMSYRSANEGMSKFDYAATMAAAVAYLAVRQQDAVGLALFDDRVTHFIRPSNSLHHWRAMVEDLGAPTGRAKTSIAAVCAELAERLSYRTMIILISDLFDDADTVVHGLKNLKYRRHETIVWNVWDQAELTFPFRGPTLFEGLEASGRLLSEPESLRARYLQEVERFQSRLRAECARMQVDYAVFPTSASLAASLAGYLATRSARLKRRSARVSGRR